MDKSEVQAQQVPQTQPQEVQKEEEPKKANFPPEFDWQLESFSEEQALKNFSKLVGDGVNPYQQKKDEESLYIAQSEIKTTTFSKSYRYLVKGENEFYGKIQITRKYSDFYQLRQLLLKRWPAFFIPPVPKVAKIGKNQTQIAKNKLIIVKNFIRQMVSKEPIFVGEEFQIFIKSDEKELTKNLEKLKPRPILELLSLYKGNWPQYFQQLSQEDIQSLQQKINHFYQYFDSIKIDVSRQKDELKKLAQLREKFNAQRFSLFSKTLPELQSISLQWFYPQQWAKKGQKEQNQQKEENQNLDSLAEHQIYTNPKYFQRLEATMQDISKQNNQWKMYEMFKFQLKEIDAILQCINEYRHLLAEKKFYHNNIEINKQQIEDVNNQKLSLKIMLLSGSEDDKRTFLTNQTMDFESNLKIMEEIQNGLTQIMITEIQNFQISRCNHYKQNLVSAFKNQAILMSKIFNLYVEAHKK